MVSEISRTDVLIPVLVDTFSYDEAFGTYQRVVPSRFLEDAKQGSARHAGYRVGEVVEVAQR